MNDKKRKVLERAGYRVGDVAEFLGLTQEERALVELRAAVSRAVQLQRKKKNVTQTTLAAMLNSSQSRVAKIEAGSSEVSLDLMFRGLFAVGGKIGDVLKVHSGIRATDAVKRVRNRHRSAHHTKAKRRDAQLVG